jgi:hypothetical protein
MAALEGLEQRQNVPEGGHPARLEEMRGQYPHVNLQTMTASGDIAEMAQSCLQGLVGEFVSGS